MSRKIEAGDSKSINLDACRFCLKVTRNKISINEEIKDKFQKLMNEELVNASNLPQTCCKTCLTEIDQSNNLKDKISANQSFLLNLASSEIKEEPEDLSNDGFSDENPGMIFVKTELVESDSETENEKPPAERDNFENLSSTDVSDDDFTIEEELKNSRVQKSRKYKCKFCKNVLGSRKTLKYHTKRFHPNGQMITVHQKVEGNKIRCKDCGLDMHCFKILAHQIAEHGLQEDQYYTCDICGSKRKNKNGISQHMTIHKAKNRSWPCETCNKVLKTKSSLDGHRRTQHESVITDVCELCGAQFKSKTSYVGHMRSAHTGEKPFQCELCEKSFHRQTSLHIHTKNIHNSNPKECHICNKVFNNTKYLNNHIQYVHEAPTNSCPFEGCNFKYSVTIKLKRHIYKRHSELKKFQCKICMVPYRNRDALQNHVYSNHMNFSVTCFIPGCTSSFHRKDYFKTHVKRYHKDLGEEGIQQLFDQIQAIQMPSIREYCTTMPYQKL